MNTHQRMVGLVVLGGVVALLAGFAPSERAVAVPIADKADAFVLDPAVVNGLAWLAGHQAADGHWSLQKFAQDARCRCAGAGTKDNDVAGTALALLPFLGAGQTHKQSKDRRLVFHNEVNKGLRWLMIKQNKEGGFDPHSGEMYSHGIATIALCKAYELSNDPALKKPAQSALDFLIKAQTPQGGWRYRPASKGYDGSIGGWAMSALSAGRNAGLVVPRETLQRATKWLDAAAAPDGGRYGYTSPHPANGLRPATTAEGLLSRQYLGWGPRSPGLLAGLQYLRAHKPRVNDMYYSWPATQVMKHQGGAHWKEWQPVMHKGLLAAQAKGDKHDAGSWYDATDRISSGHGGRIMQTSLSLLTLELTSQKGEDKDD